MFLTPKGQPHPHNRHSSLEPAGEEILVSVHMEAEAHITLVQPPETSGQEDRGQLQVSKAAQVQPGEIIPLLPVSVCVWGGGGSLHPHRYPKGTWE